MGFLFFAVFIVYGISQFVAGYSGIEHYMGATAAGLALVAALLLRFTIPITIGAFFGAWQVWHWHWFFALIFAAPGLLFMASGFIAMLTDGLRK